METDLAKVSVQVIEESEEKGEDQMMGLKIRPPYDPMMQDFQIDF